MIIYNVTINIDDSVHDQWLNWLKTKHIGDVLATGCFYKAKLSKVLVEEEMGGTTYSIQYAAESKEKLQEYYLQYAHINPENLDNIKELEKLKKSFEEITCLTG